MDVCLTKDNQIVVIHDSNLQRMTGVNKHVEEYDYKQLPQITEKVHIDFSVSLEYETKNCKTKYFPLLEDVFKQFPGTLMNIELKTPSQNFITIMNQLIIKYKRENLTIWGCRESFYNESLLKENPNIKRFSHDESVMRTFIYYMCGLIGYIDIKENTIQIPLYTKEFYNWKMSDTNTEKQKKGVKKFFFMIWFLGLISKPLIWHLKQRGIFTYVWVLNEYSEFQFAERISVQGIMTDSPTLLKKYLIDRQKYINN